MRLKSNTAGAAAQQKYREKHRDELRGKASRYYHEHKEYYSQRYQDRKQDNPIAEMLRSIEKRAKRNKIPFSITEKDIKVPEFCPILGIKLEFAQGKPKSNSPSVDKIIPQLGYVPGNVVVISYRANMIKNNATLQELESLVDWLRPLVLSEAA